MDVVAAIDQILARTDNVSPADADYTDRRTRCLEYLREIQTEVWFYDQWRFRRRSAAVAFTANDPSSDLPTDFLDIGPYGSVTRADGVKLDWVPEHRIILSRKSGHTTATPEVYSIFGQSTTTPFPQQLQVEMPSSAFSLDLEYEAVPPTLDETTNTNNLKKIPESYHQLVIIPGVRYKMLASKGDGRAAQHLQEYQRGLAYMKRVERRGKDTLNRCPSFFGEQDYR